MISNKINIIFSDIATHKISKLSNNSQNLIFSFLEEFDFSNIEAYTEVQELGNNLYKFKVNDVVNLIFAYENRNILVTDVSYNKKMESNKNKDVILKYKDIDPQIAWQKVFIPDDMKDHTSINLIYINQKAESLNLILNLVLLIFGLIIGLYLLIFKKVIILPIVLFLTFCFPILNQIIRLRKKTKSSN